MKIDSIGYKTCPGNLASPTVISWLGHHESFRRGVLPFPGSLLDQPNKVIELFTEFDNYYAERAIAQAKAEAAAMKRGRRGGLK